MIATVRQVIQELLRHNMDATVFIGLGPHAIPVDASDVFNVFRFDRDDLPDALPQGVYIVPSLHLIVAPEGFEGETA